MNQIKSEMFLLTSYTSISDLNGKQSYPVQGHIYRGGSTDRSAPVAILIQYVLLMIIL